MKITVIGPGAVGMLWAARLGRGKAQVTLLDHKTERAQILNEQGVTLTHGEDVDTVPVAATADAGVLKDTDLALLCVKAYDTRTAAQTLRDHLGTRGRALTLQNGAGNVEILAAALGEERVLGGITSEGATNLGPGRVRHAGRGETHIGPAQGPVDAFCRQVAELFNAAGFASHTREGVQNLIWTKLLINVGINPLTAALGVPNGALLEIPPAKEMMALAVGEAQEVGLALGIEFLHEDMLAAVHQVARRTAQNISSMLQDVRARKKTEIDQICGTVVREGSGQNIPTPVNSMLTLLVQAWEEKGFQEESSQGNKYYNNK